MHALKLTLVIAFLLASVTKSCNGALPDAPSTEHKAPSGSIAFIDLDGQLVLTDPHGRDQQLLTTEGQAMSPAWSPDGQMLAYVYQEKGSKERRAHLYDTSNEMDHPIEAVSDPRLSLINWSPDGRYLILDVGCCLKRELHIVRLADEQIVANLSALNYAWSPDGDRLVIGLREPLETPIPVEPGDSVSLGIVEIEQGKPQRHIVLTGTNQILYFPLGWLSDGRVLYDRLDWNESTQTGDHTLWTIALDDTTRQPEPATDVPPIYDRDAVLTRLPIEMQKPSTGSFSWSPDGQWVAFHAGEEADKSVYLFNWEEGEEPQHLVDGTDPSWRPAAAE
jgi:Tol biopolymer transport system component